MTGDRSMGLLCILWFGKCIFVLVLFCLALEEAEMVSLLAVYLCIQYFLLFLLVPEKCSNIVAFLGDLLIVFLKINIVY